MASITITVSSNQAGMIGTSHILSDQDLERILGALNDKYMAGVLQEYEEGDPDAPAKLSTQRILDIFAGVILESLNGQVKEYELKKSYKLLLDGYRNIQSRRAE